MPNFFRLVATAQLALLRALLDRMGPGNRAWLARHMMRDRRDPRQLAFADFAGHAVEAWEKVHVFEIFPATAAILAENATPSAPCHAHGKCA